MNWKFLKIASIAFNSTLLLNPLLTAVSAQQNFAEQQDLGDIIIHYDGVEDPQYQKISETLIQSQNFEKIASEYNDFLKLPKNINVYFTECDEANAYYDPEKVEILMCYELIKAYIDILAPDNLSQKEYINEVKNAAFFTFLHELGHALVDLLQLPITGKEEDAVDEFAVVMLLESGDEGIAAALAGLDQFAADAEEEAQLEKLEYWGEHSLSVQRFYNMACLIYGSDPQKFADFVEEENLPPERAETCEYEYEQKINSWYTLLEPYLKQ